METDYVVAFIGGIYTKNTSQDVDSDTVCWLSKLSSKSLTYMRTISYSDMQWIRAS